MNNRRPILLCTVLLLLFTAIAWFATSTKSPTYDEPYHAAASWLQLRYHDFRLDNQDPPLWQYWASLPNGKDALHADFHSKAWNDMPYTVASQWYWNVTTLYRTPGNDAVAFINRCRMMMLPLAVLLGILICIWSWKLAGPIAAIFATSLFSLDPNFLAHSALMKNDVVFSLTLFALALSLWKAGQKLTLTTSILIPLLCIATLATKFTGLVAVLLVPLFLGTRAILPAPWPVFKTTLITRSQRLLLATAFTLLIALISYLGIWAVYGFRFNATPDPHISLSFTEIIDHIKADQLIDHYDGHVPPGTRLPDQIPLTAKTALFANQHGLLPQAYLAGFLFTYSTALARNTYLLGQYSVVGWWWYFPFTIAVKTPIATLLLTLTTLICFIRWRAKASNLSTRWSTLCLAIPIALFLASAMSSHLNIGLRHILPIYPFAFVAIGCVAAQLWQSHGKKTRASLIAILLLLSIESLSNYPDFIPYFNFIAAPTPSSKLALLGDSNLDWGQDLPLLADWQKHNPNLPLYLCYFGLVDPVYYRIHYIPLPGGYRYDTKPQFPDPYTPSVLAISATNLQGILLDQKLRAYYANWAKRKPLAVLGGSIYLYDYDPMQTMEPPPK